MNRQIQRGAIDNGLDGHSASFAIVSCNIPLRVLNPFSPEMLIFHSSSDGMEAFIKGSEKKLSKKVNASFKLLVGGRQHEEAFDSQKLREKSVQTETNL
jgi:hypothetical protein